jgi:hypothetical protein
MKKTWIAYALAGLLASPVSHAEDVAAAAAQTPSPAAIPVQTDNPEYLKTLKRVAVTSFSVEILTYLKASEGGDLGNLISGKPNSVSVTLKGHDAASWQPLVDNYYRQLLSQLEAAGIEVVPPEKLQELAEYKTIVEAAKPTPHEEDAKAGKGLYLGTAGVPMLIQNEQNVFRKSLFSGKAPEDLYMTFGSKFSSGFATAGVQNAEFALAKKLDAHVLKVRFTVVPTMLTTTKGFWVGKSVDSKASLSLPSYVNRFVVYSPEGEQSKISLSEALASSKTVGEMNEITSTGGKALRTADTVGGIALGLVTGGIAGAIKAGANVAKDYEVVVDNTSFNQMLVEELGATSQSFVKQLKVAL